MSTTVTLNGVSYKIPLKGDVDWSALTKWIVAANTAVSAASSGTLLTPVYNVKTYGAKGDGVHDDTTAVNTALAALYLTGTNGGALYFPAGTYLITSQVMVGSLTLSLANIKVVGDGASSLIKKSGSGFGSNPLFLVHAVPNWGINSVTLDGSADTGTGDLVLVDGSNNGVVTETVIQHSKAYGINLFGTSHSTGFKQTNNIFTSNASGDINGWDSISGGSRLDLTKTPNDPAWSTLSGAGQHLLRDNAGQLQESYNGGAYSWVRNVNYVNLGDKRFGADPTGVADCSAAFNAAVAAVVNPADSTKKMVLYIPTGQYRLTSPLTISASLGLTIIGDGPFASQIIIDPAVANGNGLIINSSQFVRLRDFALVGKSTNPAGTMLTSDYNPVVNAVSNWHLENIWITGNDKLSYDTGVYCSSAYGNNSEFVYTNVQIDSFASHGVWLPGSQQYSHQFFGCQIQGLWGTLNDSDPPVDPTTGGGLYCIRVGDGVHNGGGTVQVFGGSMGTVRGGCIYFNGGGASGLPFIFLGVDSEHARRFVTATPPGGTVSPNAGAPAAHLIIQGCRFELLNNETDPDCFMELSGWGPFAITDNHFYYGAPTGGASQNYPKLRVADGSSGMKLTVRRNDFQTLNSVTVDPIVVVGTAINPSDSYDIGDNTFCDNSGLIAFRNERLNINPNGLIPTQVPIGFPLKLQSDRWAIDLPSRFTANAASQIVTLNTSALPRGMTFYEFRALLYNYLIVTGGATITMRVGTSSGGDELLSDTVLGDSGVGDQGAMYGEGSERGSAMTGSGGHCPHGEGGGATNVYVKLTASTGTLGNGTVSNITRGIIHFNLMYKNQEYFLP